MNVVTEDVLSVLFALNWYILRVVSDTKNTQPKSFACVGDILAVAPMYAAVEERITFGMYDVIFHIVDDVSFHIATTNNSLKSVTENVYVVDAETDPISFHSLSTGGT